MDVRRAMQRERDAWIVKWEWIGDHALQHTPWIGDRPIVAIFPGRTSAERVREFVELLYAASSSEPTELLQYAISSSTNPYKAVYGMNAYVNTGTEIVQATWQGMIHCGHNPHLVARQVKNLRVDRANASQISYDPVYPPDDRPPEETGA